jgi:hypothetical protein
LPSNSLTFITYSLNAINILKHEVHHRSGVSKFSVGKPPQTLLCAGLRAAGMKIAVWGTPYLLNYCAIFMGYKNLQILPLAA